MPPPIPVSPGSKTERLPWECYVLRSALDADAQLELLERVGSLAAVGFSDWPTRASSQDHPMIITSHSSNATRSRECRRACGLAKCMGHCGRHVGALVERPEDMYGLANDVAAKIARDLGETGFAMDFFSSEPADDGDARVGDDGKKRRTSNAAGTRPFEATHFWGLVYGGRDVAGREEKEKDSEECFRGVRAVPRPPSAKRRKKADEDDVLGPTVSVVGEPSLQAARVTFGGKSLSASRGTDERESFTPRDTKNSGRMASHLDRPVGWTLSVSVGKPVVFALGRPPSKDALMYGDFAKQKVATSPEQKPPGVSVVVRSGDALLFRGHAVFHAVDGFVEEEEEEMSKTFDGDGKHGTPLWRERLLAPARASPRFGWRPERLALLFRHEVDAAAH
jgi:hypothetical protein